MPYRWLRRSGWPWCLFLLVQMTMAASAQHASSGTASSSNLAVAGPAPRVQWRHPVGLALGPENLYIANHRSGTLSRVDTKRLRLESEKQVGKSLSDIVRLPDGRLLVTDEQAHQLLVVACDQEEVVIRQRLAVATAPVSIAIDATGRTGSVASLWARRVTLLRIGEAEVQSLNVIELPFAPRMQLFLPGGEHLVVADAFGGRLAIIDARRGELLTIRSIEAHNIRGLAFAEHSSQLFVTHQHLISWVPTTHNRVSWGQVVSNLVRTIDLEELLKAPKREGEDLPPVRIAHWGLEPLGENKNAAGDPGAIALTASGERIVCLSGVNQVAIAKDAFHAFERIDVGKRPTAVAMRPGDSVVYVANTFDDTISIVNIATNKVSETIALGKTPQLSIRDAGERFFYDASLSLDGWYSCHSCHTDGHTVSLLNDNFGDDLFGTPKLIPSLLGTNQTGPWGWNGNQLWIRNQVAKSINTTMQNDDNGGALYGDPVSSITDYLRSLPPPPSVYAARGDATNRASIKRGSGLFAAQGCADCHSPSVFTSEQVYDVGLADETGQTEFNPPSLLGVSQRDLWLHDGRAKRLRDVLEKVGHPNNTSHDLTSTQIDDLLRYLESL